MVGLLLANSRCRKLTLNSKSQNDSETWNRIVNEYTHGEKKRFKWGVGIKKR